MRLLLIGNAKTNFSGVRILSFKQEENIISARFPSNRENNEKGTVNYLLSYCLVDENADDNI